MHQRALDDRRANDRQRQVLEVRELLDGPFAHRLRERVDVGPSERAGARPAVVREALRHPVLAPLLGVLGHRHRAGAGVFLRRLVHEVVEHLRAPGLGLHVAPRLQGELALRPPVHPVVQRVLGDDALGDPGDVRRRDVHQARARPALDHAPVQVHGAEQVGLEPLVDRRVERDRRGGVDGDVDVAGELGHAAREVAVHDRDPLVQEGAQSVLADPPAQHVERGLAEQVLHASARRRTRLRADQQDDPALGHVAEQPLEDHLSEEAGDAGQQDRLAREAIDDRGSRDVLGVLYHAADYAVSTSW